MIWKKQRKIKFLSSNHSILNIIHIYMQFTSTYLRNLQIQKRYIHVYIYTHEGITVRWRDEDITVSSFSLYLTWRNDLRLYNRMILAIIIITMFIYSGIVVIWDTWILLCYPPVSFVPSALRRAQMTLSGGKSISKGLKMTTLPSKWTLLWY